jgi:hypothetical protein
MAVVDNDQDDEKEEALQTCRTRAFYSRGKVV